ncbi:MAG: AraC family transcriptional regulator [Desulfobacteraceae bacterium]|nr:AraC family transcriptional regulator [Desulfobacteraceae bacterium]
MDIPKRPLPENQRIEAYKARINRVMDYIESNISQSFTLDELAHVAHFSKFHFHRIFHLLVGETLFHFIQRIRVEKAAAFLKSDPNRSITEIAFDCGFTSSAAFARSFKKTFQLSASQYRKNNLHEPLVHRQSNIGKLKSNQTKDIVNDPSYIPFNQTVEPAPFDASETANCTVKVTFLQKMTVVYVRYIGPYKGDAVLFERLFEKLFKWAKPRHLLSFSPPWMFVVYHDDPGITDTNRLRISACVSVPELTRVSGEIGRMVIPEGEYALCRFHLLPSEYQAAWDWVFGSWLPQSGYVPDDRPCFERYPPGVENNSSDKCVVDICVPVKPLENF